MIINKVLINQHSALWLIYAIIVFCFISPTIPLGDGIPGIRLEQIVVVLFSVYIVANLSCGRVEIGFSTPFFLFSMALFMYILLSPFIGVVKGYPLSIRDFFELLKPFEYMVIGLITLTALLKSKEVRVKILKAIVFSGLVSCTIALSQYINPYKINSFYVHVIAPTQFLSLVDDHPLPRVVGLSSNPNMFAFLMVLSAIASAFIALVYGQLKFWIFWIFFICGVALSQSRTGLVFLIVVHGVFILQYFIQNSLRMSQGKALVRFGNVFKFLFGVFSALVVVMIVFSNNVVLTRIQDGLNFTESASVLARLEHWVEYWIIFSENMILGVGPMKSIAFSAAADNEWLLLGTKFGIVGVMLFILFILSPLMGAYSQSNCCYKFLSVATILGGFVFMLPAPMYHSMQSFPIFLILTMLMVSPKRLLISLEKNPVTGS